MVHDKEGSHVSFLASLIQCRPPPPDPSFQRAAESSDSSSSDSIYYDAESRGRSRRSKKGSSDSIYYDAESRGRSRGSKKGTNSEFARSRRRKPARRRRSYDSSSSSSNSSSSGRSSSSYSDVSTQCKGKSGRKSGRAKKGKSTSYSSSGSGSYSDSDESVSDHDESLRNPIPIRRTNASVKGDKVVGAKLTSLKLDHKETENRPHVPFSPSSGSETSFTLLNSGVRFEHRDKRVPHMPNSQQLARNNPGRPGSKADSDGNIQIRVPPGKMRVVLQNTPLGPVVTEIHPKSVSPQLKVGDTILALDGVPVVQYPGKGVMDLLEARKTRPVRLITYKPGNLTGLAQKSTLQGAVHAQEIVKRALTPLQQMRQQQNQFHRQQQQKQWQEQQQWRQRTPSQPQSPFSEFGGRHEI